jgi:hypothetical protein
MLTFNENKFHISTFLYKLLYVILNFIMLVAIILALLFRLPGSGSTFGMRIRIHVAIECGSNANSVSDPYNWQDITFIDIQRDIRINTGFLIREQGMDRGLKIFYCTARIRIWTETNFGNSNAN